MGMVLMCAYVSHSLLVPSLHSQLFLACRKKKPLFLLHAKKTCFFYYMRKKAGSGN